MENHLELQNGEWQGEGLFTKCMRRMAAGRTGPGTGTVSLF